ncbi:MAG: hypothetical protein AAGE52_33395 [Myxococcota bacterium]
MRWLCVLGLVLLGCGDDDAEAESSESVPEPTVVEVPDPDPLEGLDDIEALEREEPDPVLPRVSLDAVDENIPPRGCAPFAEQAVRVWPRSGPANIVAVGTDGFVVVGYAPKAEGEGEEIFAVTIGPQQPPRPILRESLDRSLTVARTAAPGLGVIDDAHVGIVTTDGTATVRYAVLQTGGRLDPWRLVGTHADQRFTPAMALRGGRQLVAYTDGGGEFMRVRAVLFDAAGHELGRHDLTPASMGAAAPTLVSGSDTLAFLDPREATSTVYAVDVTADPPSREVLVPLTNVFEPAVLAPVQVGETTLVGYTAVGRAAATAVGLIAVKDGSAEGPVPLVPSQGYGMLHVDGAAGPSRAVFVADRPQGEDRNASREAVAVVVEPSSPMVQGEPLKLVAPDGTGRWARITRHVDGTFAVVLTGGEGVYVHLLRCDAG